VVSRSFDLVVFDLGGGLIWIARSWDEMHERAGVEGDPLRGDGWHDR
jgi:hypothetical protein